MTERWIAASIAVTSGKHVFTIDDPVLFGRSLTKPFQMKAVQDVLADALDWRQKAVALASHNGEDEHVAVVKSILRPEDYPSLALLPSLALGGRKAEPSIWLNPCSGKHSAILLACRKNGWPMSGYTTVDHPYNKCYLGALETRLGNPVLDRTAAPDGCLLPTFAMSISELAKLFENLAKERDQDWIWEAAHRYPELVGGKGRLDSKILHAQPNVFAKEGADGLLGLAVCRGDQSIGVVIKIAHGHDPQNAERLAQPILNVLGCEWPTPAAPSGQTIKFATEFTSLIENLRTLK